MGDVNLAERIENHLRSVGWANDDLDYDAFAAALQPAPDVVEAVAAERKRCARIAEARFMTSENAAAGRIIAQDIRAGNRERG